MDISINTAQNVNIAYHPAGVAYRIIASIVDFSLLGGMTYIFSIFAITTDSGSSIFIIFFFILSFYHLLCELIFNGRSIGKMTQNLRVVRLDGKKLSFWDYFLRWIFRVIDISICFGAIAMISIVLTKRMQRLGDIVAGTTVVREKKKIGLSHFTKDDTPQEYQATFSEVTLLSDKDMNVIREALEEVEKGKGDNLLPALSLKIKELTGIQSDMDNLTFIKTIINDYRHLTKM